MKDFARRSLALSMPCHKVLVVAVERKEEDEPLALDTPKLSRLGSFLAFPFARPRRTVLAVDCDETTVVLVNVEFRESVLRPASD